MMKAIVMIALLMIPLSATAAETVRLKPLGSVYADQAGAGVNDPEGIGCNETAFTVSDTGHGRILQYTLDEGEVKPGPEIKAAEVAYPERLRMNSKGDIFVLDGKRHRIARLNASGQFMGYIGPKDSAAPGAVWFPRSLAIDRNDNLYVLDVTAPRVLVFGPDGASRREIPCPQEEGFFSDVAVDAGGRIYLLNSVSGSIWSAAADADTFKPLVAKLKEYVNFPTSLAVDGTYIFVVDQNGGDVAILGKDGAFLGHKLRMGWKEGELRYPSDICLDDKGDVFIADRGNNRVQIFHKEMETKEQ